MLYLLPYILIFSLLSFLCIHIHFSLFILFIHLTFSIFIVISDYHHSLQHHHVLRMHVRMDESVPLYTYADCSRKWALSLWLF